MPRLASKKRLSAQEKEFQSLLDGATHFISTTTSFSQKKELEEKSKESLQKTKKMFSSTSSVSKKKSKSSFKVEKRQRKRFFSEKEKSTPEWKKKHGVYESEFSQCVNNRLIDLTVPSEVKYYDLNDSNSDWENGFDTDFEIDAHKAQDRDVDESKIFPGKQKENKKHLSKKEENSEMQTDPEEVEILFSTPSDKSISSESENKVQSSISLSSDQKENNSPMANGFSNYTLPPKYRFKSENKRTKQESSGNDNVNRMDELKEDVRDSASSPFKTRKLAWANEAAKTENNNANSLYKPKQSFFKISDIPPALQKSINEMELTGEVNCEKLEEELTNKVDKFNEKMPLLFGIMSRINLVKKLNEEPNEEWNLGLDSLLNDEQKLVFNEILSSAVPGKTFS